ncbi:MAG: L-ribulose-5-phosphate 4-epimerase AraD [Kiritimatiellia bacterium]
MNTRDLREACCAANRQLPATGLVDLTFGNVSVCDRALGVFAIKPSGVPYDQLTPDHMVVLDFDGQVVEGTLKPSSDEPTHRLLLRHLPEVITSVVHTHSRNAVAFAQAGRDLPCLGTTHSDYFLGPVPVTRALTPDEVSGAYEAATGEVILECFQDRDPVACPAVLVRHHGPFTWGENAPKAVENALALDICADLARRTLALDSAAKPVPSHLLHKHHSRKHGPDAYYGQNPIKT